MTMSIGMDNTMIRMDYPMLEFLELLKTAGTTDVFTVSSGTFFRPEFVRTPNYSP
jgi:hypothetical protein